MTDETSVEAVLRRLAGGAGEDGSGVSAESPPPLEDDYRTAISRAAEALEDLDAAAAFVEDGGLDDLERAIELAERSTSACAETGRETLSVYRRFRAAAAGDQFHSGRGTSLGDGDKAETR